MPLIILPLASELDGTASAQAKLKAEIDDPFAAILVVFGIGPEINRVVEVATARASLSPLRRHIVWAPDTNVLTDAQREDLFPDKTVVAVIGLDNKVKVRLNLAKAQVPFFIEQAYTKAGA
jgi:hypothetical protein